MKKLFLSIFMLSALLFAEEAILISSDTKADLNGYDYVSNFTVTSNSGFFTKDDFIIKEPNENGFRFLAKVPNQTTNYEIKVAYPSFLNQPNTQAGYIENASTIKQIKVTGRTNRPYDEIILLYSTSPNGKVNQIKLPQDLSQIHSMEEFTLVYDNPLYQEDVAKRTLLSEPVLGSETNDSIYLIGFRIKVNPAPSNFAYSEYSLVQIKEVSVTYDNKFTPEQLEVKNSLKQDFSISNNSLSKKAQSDLEEKIRLQNIENSLKHKDEK